MGVSLKCNVGSLMQVMKLLKNEFPEMLESTDVFSLAKVMLHMKDVCFEQSVALAV